MGWFFMTEADRLIDVFKRKFKMLNYDDASSFLKCDNYEINILNYEIEQIRKLQIQIERSVSSMLIGSVKQDVSVAFLFKSQIKYRKDIISNIKSKERWERIINEREPCEEDINIIDYKLIWNNEEEHDTGITNERFVNLLKQQCLKCSQNILELKKEINKFNAEFHGDNMPKSIQSNIEVLEKEMEEYEGDFNRMDDVICKLTKK